MSSATLTGRRSTVDHNAMTLLRGLAVSHRVQSHRPFICWLFSGAGGTIIKKLKKRGERGGRLN